MASIDVPIKVQLGCDDCYRFLLAERAKWNTERDRLREALELILRVHDTLPEHITCRTQLRRMATVAREALEGTPNVTGGRDV